MQQLALGRRCMTMKAWIIVILLAAVMQVATAQFTDAPPAAGADTAAAQVDTTVERRNGILDVFEGNPGRAAIHGLLIPAGGQIYNRRWWKVPLALGVEAGTISWLAFAYERYDHFDAMYIRAIDSDIMVEPDDEPDAGIILQNRNNWRSRREMGWVFFAAGHIFTAFEAYIDRHLLEFDVSDDLTFMPVQSLIGPVPAVTYSIPLTTQRYKSVGGSVVFDL